MRFKNLISHCILKLWFDHGRVTFLAKKNSEKAKPPKICVSFGGCMPIAQIKQCHLTPSPTLLGNIKILWLNHANWCFQTILLVNSISNKMLRGAIYDTGGGVGAYGSFHTGRRMTLKKCHNFFLWWDQYFT